MNKWNHDELLKNEKRITIMEKETIKKNRIWAEMNRMKEKYK